MAVLEHLPLGDIRENSREGRVRKHPSNSVTRKGYRASLSGPLCNRTCLLVPESALPKETTELSLYLLICYHFLICSAGESTGEWIPLYIRIDYTPCLSNKCVKHDANPSHTWVQPFSLIISIYMVMDNRQALMTHLHVVITYIRVPVCKHSKIYIYICHSYKLIYTCRKSLYLDTA